MKVIYVDIDGTICTITPDNNYILAQPFPDRIEEINKLYDEGHEITYWTARGAISGRDWKTLTTEQLNEWGAKYHHLVVGNKPHFDMYICDKSVNSDDFFKYKQKTYSSGTIYGGPDYGFHL